jgi:hypothetical protein
VNESRFTGWRKSRRSDANGNCVEVATANWRKSSRSAADGNCVEVGQAGWRKSSRSGSTENCVGVKADERVVGVRDTKLDDAGPVLEFPASAWRMFIDHAKSGQLESDL